MFKVVHHNIPLNRVDIQSYPLLYTSWRVLQDDIPRGRHCSLPHTLGDQIEIPNAPFSHCVVNNSTRWGITHPSSVVNRKYTSGNSFLHNNYRKMRAVLRWNLCKCSLHQSYLTVLYNVHLVVAHAISEDDNWIRQEPTFLNNEHKLALLYISQHYLEIYSLRTQYNMKLKLTICKFPWKKHEHNRKQAHLEQLVATSKKTFPKNHTFTIWRRSDPKLKL